MQTKIITAKQAKDKTIIITIQWFEFCKGFGNVYLLIDKNNNLTIDSECMNKDFVKKVLSHLIDNNSTLTDL